MVVGGFERGDFLLYFPVEGTPVGSVAVQLGCHVRLPGVGAFWIWDCVLWMVILTVGKDGKQRPVEVHPAVQKWGPTDGG